MSRNETDVASVQIGSLEYDSQEIMTLINSYPLSVDFVNWVSDGKYVERILSEHTSDKKYSKIVQFYIEDRLVLTAKAEFYLDKISTKYTTPTISNAKAPGSPLEGVNVEKKCVYKMSNDPHYTTISHLYENEKLYGIIWEIYELKLLSAIYQQKNDPLRYWRNQ